MREAFMPERRGNTPLSLGSVKSQFGHLEGASGLVSVAKCILMLENRILLPNADFQAANGSLKLTDWNMRVNLALITRTYMQELTGCRFCGVQCHGYLVKSEELLSTTLGLAGRMPT